MIIFIYINFVFIIISNLIIFLYISSITIFLFYTQFFDILIVYRFLFILCQVIFICNNSCHMTRIDMIRSDARLESERLSSKPNLEVIQEISS